VSNRGSNKVLFSEAARIQSPAHGKSAHDIGAEGKGKVAVSGEQNLTRTASPISNELHARGERHQSDDGSPVNDRKKMSSHQYDGPRCLLTNT
jgi:hypothetical protein